MGSNRFSGEFDSSLQRCWRIGCLDCISLDKKTILSQTTLAHARLPQTTLPDTPPSHKILSATTLSRTVLAHNFALCFLPSLYRFNSCFCNLWKKLICGVIRSFNSCLGTDLDSFLSCMNWTSSTLVVAQLMNWNSHSNIVLQQVSWISPQCIWQLMWARTSCINLFKVGQLWSDFRPTLGYFGLPLSRPLETHHMFLTYRLIQIAPENNTSVWGNWPGISQRNREAHIFFKFDQASFSSVHTQILDV